MQRVWRYLLLLAGLLLMTAIACTGYHRPAVFFAEDQRLIMEGVIDTDTPRRLAEVLERHPHITTIVLLDVEGSVDDAAGLAAGRLVREKGLATHIPAAGVVASGGTDFFLAGAKRTVETGAKIGVHAWAEGRGGQTANGFAEDHPNHRPYLDYYRDMDVPEAFYWFTLKAAPAESMHWMTEAELAEFGFITP